MTPEGKVKSAIKKWLDAHGFWRAGAKRPERVVGWYTMPVNNGMGVHGIPDFRLVYMGLSFDIEAKAPGEGPTANQLQRHLEIREAGGFVVVLDDVSKLEGLLYSAVQTWRERFGREIFGAGGGAGASPA